MAEPTRELIVALVGLRKACRSGILEIRIDDLTTTLTLANGEIVGVKTSKPGEPLGRILTRKGFLTQEHYIDVLERMSSALALGERVRFGEIAVELGYVGEEAVRQCLTEQQRSLAGRVFQSTSPTWSFEETAAVTASSSTGAIQIEALFLHAVRWADDARKGKLGLDENRHALLEAVWELEEIDARFELTDDESAFVHGALGGNKTVAELLGDGSVAESVDVHAVLAAILATGAARASRADAGPRPESIPPAAARRAPRAATEWTIDAGRAKSALAKIVLAKVSVPLATDSSRSVEQQLRSEQAFLRGKELLRNAKTTEAQIELERAFELRPESLEYELFVKWTREANGQKATAESHAELERLASAALRDDPKLGFAHFVLGELLRERGDVEEARRQLRHALRLEPDLCAGLRSHRIGAIRLRQPSPANAAANALAPEERHAPHVTLETQPVATESRVATHAAEPAAPALPDAQPAPEAAEVAAAAPSAVRDTTASSRWRAVMLVASGAVVVAGAAGFALLEAANGSPPGPSLATSSARLPPPAPSESSAAIASASAEDASFVVAAVDASVRMAAADDSGAVADDAAATDGGGQAIADATTGIIVLGASAVGHRVFIDGRVVPSADDRITVACGRHVVRIGSQGRSVNVEVPCGRDILLP